MGSGCVPPIHILAPPCSRLTLMGTQTALHVACGEGMVEAVALLLDQAALDPNSAAKGWVPQRPPHCAPTLCHAMTSPPPPSIRRRCMWRANGATPTSWSCCSGMVHRSMPLPYQPPHPSRLVVSSGLLTLPSFSSPWSRCSCYGESHPTTAFGRGKILIVVMARLSSLPPRFGKETSIVEGGTECVGHCPSAEPAFNHGPAQDPPRGTHPPPP